MIMRLPKNLTDQEQKPIIDSLNQFDKFMEESTKKHAEKCPTTNSSLNTNQP